MKKEVQQGRLLLDPCGLEEAKWSHRSSWISGNESAYALLAKFAELNALSNRDLCEIFVIPQERGRSASWLPKVDLRSTEGLRTAQLSNLIGIDSEQLEYAFVSKLFPNAWSFSSEALVWCPVCAQQGFHSAAYQLNFCQSCPVHHLALRRACPLCKAQVPYTLNARQSKPLFTCANCGADFARKLRTVSSALYLNDRAQLIQRDHIDLIRFTDTLPTLFNACRQALGRPNLPIQIGKADFYRRSGAFHRFVADVLVAVSSSRASPQLFMLEPVASLAEISEPPMRKKGDAGEEALKEASSLYRSLKRKIYRQYCRGHASCIRAAKKTLWWDMEGERTPVFCPTAIAFLRWRMSWESSRVPSLLDAGKPRVAYGLVAWLASEAPIGSPLWNENVDAWLRAHLLTCALLDTFAEWLDYVVHVKTQVRWTREVTQQFGKRHWACSGRGTVEEPALLFIEPPYKVISAPIPASGAHLRHSLSVLASIRH